MMAQPSSDARRAAGEPPRRRPRRMGRRNVPGGAARAAVRANSERRSASARRSWVADTEGAPLDIISRYRCERR